MAKRTKRKGLFVLNPRDPDMRRKMAQEALMNRRRYVVSVEYDGPLNHELERLLRRGAPRPSDGSGLCFLTGKRDHSWHYVQFHAAQRCLEAVRNVMLTYCYNRHLNWSATLTDEHTRARRQLKKLGTEDPDA